jgi:hemoglobin
VAANEEVVMPESSLYVRLGGAEGIRQIIEDVVAAHLDNPVVGERFRKVEDIANLKTKAWEFFCAGAGGPETYSGKDMISAHQGMNVTEAEYAAVTDDILFALEKNRIDKDTANDVRAILDSLRSQVVGV